MMTEKIYQSIYDELYKYLINGWDRFIIYLEYGNASYSFSFYERIEGKYIKCFDLPGIAEEKLMESFARIDKMLENERKKDEETWTNMTIIIDAFGNMHADLDYTDLSEGTYQFMKDWKHRYLV